MMSENSKKYVTVAVLSCLVVTLYLLTFPLQDFDTFWHLAYGRAMVESGSFINHEIFSYTAQGNFLGSHSQLAQVFIYCAWVIGGANALLGLKLLITTGVFFLIVATVRLFGVNAVTGAALALSVLTAGMSRMVERPELFSVLLQALLIWLLFRARRNGYTGRELWVLPLVLVAWDYLHGAVYGFVLVLTFAGAELLRAKLLPRWKCRWGVGDTNTFGVKRLFLWLGLSLGVMLAHPNGLLNYSFFWRVGTADDYRMFGEFMSPTKLQFIPYWIFLGFALMLILWNWRHCDLSTIILSLPFLYLSLNFNRSVMAFCLAAIPAIAQALKPLSMRLGAAPRGRMLGTGLLVLLLGSVLLYKQFWVIDSFRFGTGVSGQVFPVGSARFVKERNLTGNMYNMNGFGGYLAYYLAPERKIFHYNQPGVFTDLFDYLHKPASHREWTIDYAIVGDALELNMFEREGFVTVYREPTAAVLVRNDDRNATLIQRYRVRTFGPLMSNEQLLARARYPATAQRLLVEISDYLAFREDRRVATLFIRLLQQSPGLFNDAERTALLEPLRRYNSDSLPM